MTQPEPIAIVGISAIMPDAPTAQDFWSNIRGGRYSISDVPAERWDPELFYDADPYIHRGQDVLEDRRLGPGVPVGADGVEAAHPAERGRALRRGPDVVGQRRALGAARRRVAELGRGLRPRRGDPRQRARGRQVRAHDPAHRLPGVRPRAGAVPVVRGPAGRRPGRRSGPRRASGSSPACPPSPRTRCPVSWPTSWPAGWRPCSTCAGPNFTTDAACASALAGMSAAIAGLQAHHYDAVHLRGRRPQHGSRRLRALLQDRRAVGHRHAARSTPARTAS